MSYAAWVERHRRSLLTVSFALALGGLAAAFTLPVGLFPATSFPRIRAEISVGSMPARQMLVDVTEPLEEVARSVPGALNVESTTSRGSAEMFIDFPWGYDMTQALLGVEAAFAQKLPELPAGTSYEVLQMSPNVIMPFVSYALISDQVAASELRRTARYQLAPLLTGIPGVRRVGVLGGEVPEVEIAVRPESLRSYGITLAELTQALASANVVSASGRLEDNDLLFLAIDNNAFDSLQSVRDVTVRTGKGSLVRLADIASVEMGSVPQWLLVDDNGRPAVTFDVYQQDSADSLSLARAVAQRVAAFMRTQSPAIGLYKWYDQTELVRSSIAAVVEAILIGLVFAGCVIFGFLRNWRATLVAVLIVPLAVLITVLLLALLGMSFNIMTLGGIAAAIGLLIDDAIVMIEHIARRAGAPGVSDPRGTVLGAAAEFRSPLIGSSLASVVIFLPLAFLTGIAGAFFKFLALTMAIALVVSYALTAVTVPLLARGIIDFDAWRDPAQQREGWLRRAHARALDALFARPAWLGVGVGVLILAGYLAYTHLGTGFLPRMDEGGFVLDYYTAPGTSLTETDRELKEVEAILKQDPSVYTYSRRTGAGLGGDLAEAYQGDFFVRLVDPSRRPPIWTVMDRITARVSASVPGINLDTHELLNDMIGDMVGRPEPIVVKLSARDPSVLARVAAQIATAIAKVPGVEPSSVNNGVVPAGDALEIRVDQAAAAAEGLTPAEVQSQVYHYLNGDVVTQYLGTVEEVGVRLWMRAPTGRIFRDRLGQLPIRAADGHLIPLATVARTVFVAGQPELTRDNLAQIVAVTAEIAGAHDLGSTVAAVRRVLDTPGIVPPGVRYTIGGAYEQQQIAARGMTRVFVAAVIAEILLLLFLYERFWIPLIILASSIISTGAVFIGLWVTRVELNITAMMGMVMIVGVATEMAVFLVSEFQALATRMPVREALHRAALDRLRPITMSALAMILALVPLGAAVSGSGDQMLQPLAIAIIAGALVQLPLVLLAMPVVMSLALGRAAGLRQ
ncbi:MAG TPA: efflux RND transporter permease subunit [Steroidobacteraceae bacterium]|nr:efflux RND transporter permease subunit [Steroidobacteraceae bacterium]